MSILNLSASVSTPKLFVDNEHLNICGETKPENSKQFYDQVFNALTEVEKLFKENKVYTYHFNFDFEYISTSSLVMLKKLLMEIKSLQDQYPLISVSWIYYQMDEDMRLVGEEMVLITEVKMEVKERNEG